MSTERLSNRQIATLKHLAICCANGGQVTLTRDQREAARDLQRGGIIGSVEVVDVVTSSDSPWFFGPRGLVLSGAEPCAFIPSVGALGYFRWSPADPSGVPPPAKWMLPVVAAPEKVEQIRRVCVQGALI